MAIFEATVTKFRCEHCKKEWIPRGGKPPAVCPRCKRPNWNDPRRPRVKPTGGATMIRNLRRMAPRHREAALQRAKEIVEKLQAEESTDAGK
ncbi:MAG: hypothetical protein ABIH23_18545 [bacterium]